jgi:uncharacterized membrane protein
VCRNNNPNTNFSSDLSKVLIYILLFVSFYVTIVASIYRNKKITDVFIWCLFIPLLLLSLFNLIGYYVGISPYTPNTINRGTSVMLSLIGLDVDRASFPFSPGFNNFGAIMGVLFLFSLSGLFFVKKFKILFYLGLISSLIIIMFNDTRSALLFSLIIVLLNLLKRNSPPKWPWFIPLISIIGPFFIVIPTVLLSNLFDFSFMQRGADDLSSFSGRDLIWFASFSEFISFKPIHIIGFGEYGHFVSGASKAWSFYFETEDNALLTTPHSFFYSILFDYGYLGVLMYFYFQFKLISKLKKYWDISKPISILLLSFFIYWNLIGISESIHGFYTPIFLYYYSAIAILIIHLKFFNTDSQKNPILLNK